LITGQINALPPRVRAQTRWSVTGRCQPLALQPSSERSRKADEWNSATRATDARLSACLVEQCIPTNSACFTSYTRVYLSASHFHLLTSLAIEQCLY
jgi:hypothetical protein